MPSKTNQAFLNAIADNPADKTTFGVWADHLEEQGHDELAKFIRHHTVNHDSPPRVPGLGLKWIKAVHRNPEDSHDTDVEVRTSLKGNFVNGIQATDEGSTTIRIKPADKYEDHAIRFNNLPSSAVESLRSIAQESPEQYSAYAMDYEKSLTFNYEINNG